MIDRTLVAAFAPGYGSLADPPGSSVITAAVSWLEAMLLGSLATTAAVIAVAAVGFMMLSGRLSVRPGLNVIAGSFILFGASTIAAGIRSSAASAPQTAAYSDVPPPPEAYAAAATPPAAVASLADDPHAGAALPAQ